MDLKADQIVNYLDVAREHGISAVITVSHQVEPTPGVHPVIIDGRKTKKVKLHHLSWSRIHTEALIQQATKAVSDRDQAWILSEFIRYLEEPKAGALDFDDMGSSWVGVRNSVAQGTTRAGDQETLDVVSRRATASISFAASRHSPSRPTVAGSPSPTASAVVSWTNFNIGVLLLRRHSRRFVLVNVEGTSRPS